jgi:quinoprotein glucose dehydrogenase
MSIAWLLQRSIAPTTKNQKPALRPSDFIAIVLLSISSFSCEKKTVVQQGQDVTDRYDNYTDWAIYRGDKKSNQYAELAQINASNVHKLRPVWEYHTGDPNGPSMYSNPIIVNGLMYFTTPRLDAVALNAVTGQQVWKFVSSEHTTDKKVFRGRSRGVTYWEGDAGKRIFHFVNNKVYALDATSGDLIHTFGRNGSVDLRHNLRIDSTTASIEVTTPGIVYKNFLIVTSRVPEDYNSTPGDVRAYDAVTGEFKWIFHTVPQSGEFGHDTWEWVEGERYGGANPWGGFSVDEKRGLVFFATGSPANDFYGGFRKGTNLFGNCVIALDATTGERKWHYQTVHHDIWDYDNPPAPILVTITRGKESRDAVVQLTKTGLTFVLDRETGEPIFPVEEVPVPPSKIPGEEAWPTQPFPLKPPPLVRLSLHEADLTQVTPESYASALEEFRKYETGFIYTPPSLQGTITTPSHQGGVEWGGASFDPYSNILYVNANEAPSINTLKMFYEIDQADATPAEVGALVYRKNCTSCHGLERQGNPPVYPALKGLKKTDDSIRSVLREGKGIMPAFPQLSNREINALISFLKREEEVQTDESANSRLRYSVEIPFFLDPYGAPAISPPWGTLNAVDLQNGTILWKVPLGEYPQLVAKGIRNTGAKNFGGPVSTAGGVIFIAATPDEKIRAFETHSGRVLWEYKLPAGGYATPSVYQIGGKQYVVIAAGGGGKNGTPYGDSIIAFALPEEEHNVADTRSQGWRELFDGETLSGWVHMNGAHNYTVEDGAIVGRTVAGSPNSFLCTTREFSDFELTLEAMVDSVTNSGIQIRSKARPVSTGAGHDLRAGRVNGPQVELQRNHRPGTPTTGLIYGEALGTGWLSSKEKIQDGHHYLFNEGWNNIRILAQGPRIRTWVNGHPVEDLTLEEVYKTHSRGFIGLQMHGMPDARLYTMRWRKIRVREL